MSDHSRQTDAGSPRLPATMLAWNQHRYGGPDTVAAERVEVPTPGPGEVLVRVEATALNSGDIRLMRGDPLLVRLAFGLRRPKRPGRGMDVAGTVVGIGPRNAGEQDADAPAFAIGDPIVGELPGGGLAPYVVAPAARLVTFPRELSAQDAAALPIAAGTAVQALDAAHVVAGHRVLVIGASGGVGTFVVQLAAIRGADVWALCGSRSIDAVSGLGASHVFDYTRVQPGCAELPDGSFDAVIVIAGSAPLRALQRLVREGGTVVCVSGDGSRVLGPIGRMVRAACLSIGSRRPIRSLAAHPDPRILRDLIDLTASGRLRPLIDRAYPLEEAPAALAHVDAGHTVGKVVVLPPWPADQRETPPR